MLKWVIGFVMRQIYIKIVQDLEVTDWGVLMKEVFWNSGPPFYKNCSLSQIFFE